MSGWIKTYRSLADHWLAEQPEKLGWWVLLLLKVSHEDKKILIGNHLVELKRGQINISFSSLAELWKTSKASAERFVELLEEEQMIKREVRHKLSIITICNYESYQDKKRAKRDDDEPIERQTRDTNKEDKEIYKSSTAHTCEEEFIRRYREEGDSGMWSNTALVLHKNIPACKDLFERWIVEYQHNGETHRDYTDFKKHFISWSRITISKESRQQSNGNNRPDYSRRGRADVPEDITLDF